MDHPHDEERPWGWEAEEVVAGRYLLERQIGSGSTGDVWLAHDRLLKKSVALKVLKPELAKSRDTVRRFLREVALAHSVTHPHVVRIYDTGEEGGLPFFTMEYVKGQTLEERIDHSESPLPFKEIRRVALGVLDGLDAAHQVGVIHRDLKPSNVMLTHRGALVMDFGVAGIEDAPAGSPSASTVKGLVRTEVGTIFGSPAYMAPELWEGETASVRTDLFAFGIMLYQMITGRLPYRAKTPAGYLRQLSTGKPPPIRALRRDTPWPFLRTVGRCMSLSPSDRPATAAAAANLLNPLRTASRRRFAVVATGAMLGVGAAALWQTPWDMRAHGLPDSTAQLDLNAAVRMFDAGEDAAALRLLDRISSDVPDSAAITFWQAAIHHELGDEAGRHAVCEREGAVEGNATWQERAREACEETFTVGEDALDPDDELLPLAIQSQLLREVIAEPDPSGPAHERAQAMVQTLRDHEEDDDPRALVHRAHLARVDLELALGRTDEAEALLSRLVDESPNVPLYATRAAWLAARLGHHDKASTLAQRVRPVDPMPSVRRLMDAGRMREAWAEITALSEHPSASGLRVAWCAMAWRFETQRPSQCGDLPPGLVHDLWSRDGSTTATAALDKELVAIERELAQGRCPPQNISASTLAPVQAGFETLRAEQALRAALCQGDIPTARERASRLLATAPGDPWALVLAAEVTQHAQGEAPAEAHRLEAAVRWRDADPDLPKVARLRRLLDEAPSGPRSAQSDKGP